MSLPFVMQSFPICDLVLQYLCRDTVCASETSQGFETISLTPVGLDDECNFYNDEDTWK